MTTNGSYSARILDKDNIVTSFDVGFTNSTDLLADINSWATALTTKLDAAIDGQILETRLIINPETVTGIKSAPAAGAESERTGLITLTVPGTLSHYSVDVPSYAYAHMSDGSIIRDSVLTDLVTALVTVGHSTQGTTRDSLGLGTLVRALKTFRKHRRSLRRAIG